MLGPEHFSGMTFQKRGRNYMLPVHHSKKMHSGPVSIVLKREDHSPNSPNRSMAPQCKHTGVRSACCTKSHEPPAI